MSRTYSHGALKTFQRCAKKWSYRYIDKIEPKEKKVAMQRGSDIHEMLANYYDDGAGRFDALFLGIENYDLINRYARKYEAEDEAWTILHIEEEFTFTVGPFEVIFIPDLVIEINGEVWIVDHKTTANIPDEWDPYNMTDFQHLLYVAGLQQLGYNVKGFLFNYIRSKPPTQPVLIKDGSRIADVRRVDTDYDTLKGFALTYKVYSDDVAARLQVIKLTADKFFQRHFLLINQFAVDQAVEDTLDVLNQMAKAEATSAYPRHVVGKHGGSQSCGSCEYQSICFGELTGMNTDTILLDYIEREKRS